MKTNYYIITGISSGIGAALGKEVLKNNGVLFGISRRNNPELIAFNSKRYNFFEFNLKEVNKIESLIHSIKESISPEKCSSIVLINNAGIVEPIGPVWENESGMLKDNLTINLVAPAMLSTCFFKSFNLWQCRKMIVNISSGAGSHPYQGWAGYCTSKSGINMFTKCVALEQNDQPYPTVVCAVSPGVVDTPMQKQVRSTDAIKFPRKSRFVELKKHNLLSKPEDVARKITQIIEGGKIQNGAIIDLREM
ncbi:(S)-benzoin forming benzil reductase [Chitinispirillales bacterium ANBcel5]|uniref:(S)-benzoin forming benzil reductase n=1 Tax=Cellulosispirillum alkaliphilum TaxID=3039283 RepID=UPI002A561213|nr:(S)-benzoin forming benzil reductase [Chitinispirillales bacterium ANBcel5]